MPEGDFNRRDFIRQAGGAGASMGLASSALAARPAAKMSSRIIGANDRIQVAAIGAGGRGYYVSGVFHKIGAETNTCAIVGVCDTYQKRVTKAKETYKAEVGTLDYREILSRKDVDAVIVATPDHWHAPIALEAMDSGKDVYLEKPMCHTIEEARQLVQTVKETQRVLQVGSQTTSGDQWHKARKAMTDGMIGKQIMSQGSYHRNSIEGEWNWKIDAEAGPGAKGEDYIDWKMWLGKAPKRPYDADRFFRFRKYWDYSGGIATDLFFHVAAPMNICWGKPQFPSRVVSSGGIYAFHDREVPDTFHLLAEYPEGFSVVLSSSMANSQHIPGLIRGKDATLIMVEHGRFEGLTDHITVRPERAASPEYLAKFGKEEIRIPVDPTDPMRKHVTNFLDCMRTRQKPTLDVETAAHAQVLISMSVMSYRQGKVLYFDEAKWKVTDKPVKA
ncbi:MAG: Gfo/Idh/MocA family oxidoreductase [Bryobacterales bacterium]|nr:Gfo/Idh/MocA family oxidoreductase [Bryobacterales bacterium]